MNFLCNNVRTNKANEFLREIRLFANISRENGAMMKNESQNTFAFSESDGESGSLSRQMSDFFSLLVVAVPGHLACPSCRVVRHHFTYSSHGEELGKKLIIHSVVVYAFCSRRERHKVTSPLSLLIMIDCSALTFALCPCSDGYGAYWTGERKWKCCENVFLFST